MVTVIGHVKNGVVVPDTELDLPEGTRVEVRIESLSEMIGSTQQDVCEPNYRALAILEEIKKRHEGRPYTDGSQTDRIIREGRAGAMWGLEPQE